jgi:predicted transposase YdaD
MKSSENQHSDHQESDQPNQNDQSKTPDSSISPDQQGPDLDFFHPHDSFFRSYFKDPQVFTSLVQAVVPHQVSNLIDFSTLSFDPDTFVGIDYRNHFSDLVATVMTKGTGHTETPIGTMTGAPTGTLVKIYLLAEHKSYNDPKALLQMARYQLELWEKEAKDQSSKPLSPVIPILFHHGPAREVRSEFAQLFEPLVDPALLPYIPKFIVGLMNVTVLGEDDFPPDPKLSLALWSFKYARTQTKKVILKIATMLNNITKLQDLGIQIDQVELYITSVSPLTYGEYLDTMNKYLENEIIRKELMFRPNTMIAKEAKRHHEMGLQEGYQRGIEQGIERGIEKGIEQGLEQGVIQTQQQIVESMRKKGFSDQEISEITEINI